LYTGGAASPRVATSRARTDLSHAHQRINDLPPRTPRRVRRPKYEPAANINTVRDVAASDGATFEGAADDVAACDGATCDGAASDGATFEGAADDAATFEGAADDVAACDGATCDGAASDGATCDGAAGDGIIVGGDADARDGDTGGEAELNTAVATLLSAAVARSSPASAASLIACTSTKARRAMSAMTTPLLCMARSRALAWPPANS
jgi:hypothetical protein